MADKKKFPVGTKVRVPGMNGEVVQVEEEPHGIGGEYLHKIKTKFGERPHEPGCNLELVP
jgi:hypothetical protein